MTHSTLLDNLTREVAIEVDGRKSSLKSAELAAYHARIGNLTEGQCIIDRLRIVNAKNPSGELSAWIHFSQGLLTYFSEGSYKAGSGVWRAQALCASLGLRDLNALCLAWLAQWAYLDLRFDSVALRLKEVFIIAVPADHGARARASLVGAQALHLAGRFDLAEKWYICARLHATAETDEAGVNALLHNMAWIHMLNVRKATLAGEAEVSQIRQAILTVESSINFGTYIREGNWKELAPLLVAQLHSFRGNEIEALRCYELGGAKEILHKRLQANLYADIAWCNLKVGNSEMALAYEKLSKAALETFCDIDDLAAAHSRLADMYGESKKQLDSEYHRTIARKAWAEFEVKQREAVALLSALTPS